MGSRGGRLYVVTDSSDDDPVNPKPGTLRHAVIQDEPLWITFQHDMVITLKDQLVMNSYKTIDGRGASVHVTGSGCIIIHQVSNIIIHGIHIHDCKPSGDGMVKMLPMHPSITISNNYMTHHNKVMLLGHSDTYVQDKDMQVTVAFNHFGEGLVQRMPRGRHGYFHVVNNVIPAGRCMLWEGVLPQLFTVKATGFLPVMVTKREEAPESEWRNWNWKSEGDLMLNGAYFRQSGSAATSTYARASSLSAYPSHLVGSITMAAAVLNCKKGSRC
ncbi:hypothetical protein Cgig2_032896 [Carnegiea gigantea]|uniref:Pectate lyase n=1 Tax=Carnegiea gigantea TaxID=171969 RepID=A0A9Q1Q956_9CARY|nr:hypothetical protein Cgig2_032896 [Carnegiea gigantea]